MRVLLINKSWFLSGGVDRVVFETKKVLEQAGHEVEIFGMNNRKNIFFNNYFVDEVDYRQVKGFKKIKAGFNFIYNFQAKKNLKKLIKEFKPDVAHLHNIYHQLSFSVVSVLKEEKIPMVMTLHDYKLISPNYNLFHHGKINEESFGGKYYNCFFKNCLEKLLWSFLAMLEAYFVKIKKYHSCINVYISPSNFLKRKFIQAGFKQKIEIIRNPISFDFINDDNYLQEKTGGYILYFGRLSKEKGVDLIISLAKKTKNINYKIVGNGPLESFYKEQSKNIKNIEFLNFIDGEELRNLIKNSSFILHPAVWYENYPMSILESFALGKLVIASDIGGISEIVPNEFLFKAGDLDSALEKIKYVNSLSFKEIKIWSEKLKSQILKENNSEVYLTKILNIYKNAISK